MLHCRPPGASVNARPHCSATSVNKTRLVKSWFLLFMFSTLFVLTWCVHLAFSLRFLLCALMSRSLSLSWFSYHIFASYSYLPYQRRIINSASECLIVHINFHPIIINIILVKHKSYGCSKNLYFHSDVCSASLPQKLKLDWNKNENQWDPTFWSDRMENS